MNTILRALRRIVLAAISGLVVLLSVAVLWGVAGTHHPNAVASGTSHYEYVFPDGEMDVYDMDNNFALVKKVSLPTTAGTRGVVFSPVTHMLYVSYGNDGAWIFLQMLFKPAYGFCIQMVCRFVQQ